MADAYARVTGKPGVCMASNGPGVATALPGVAVENGVGDSRKGLGETLGQALRPEPDGLQRVRPARGALRGPADVVAAVVAEQALVATVVRPRDRAVAAAEVLAARPAEE